MKIAVKRDEDRGSGVRAGEVARVEGFQSGDVTCPRCGAQVTLWWNGGELDERTCCGLTFRTEHVRTDLVVTEA